MSRPWMALGNMYTAAGRSALANPTSWGQSTRTMRRKEMGKIYYVDKEE